MNAEHDTNLPDESQRPYGSRPDRSRAPLVLWGVLYVLWFGVLLWMAIAHVGE